ncbi:hypothetical protein ACFFP0_16755 [Rhizobium puerariae]|uniref:Pyruvate carboxyltransferase domain-containing protein n=1 Tax=Rhizobium puerariae TaxID=1585791 RepID=A0ABV6AIR1_9HYPH
MSSRYPTVHIREELLRDGLQIEDESISVEARVKLLDLLSRSGLKQIVIGSFVSPKYTPQMAKTDEVAARFTPREGVTYTALIPNEKGRERAAPFTNKIQMERHSLALTGLHMCDVFPRRNWNRSQQDEIDKWPAIIERAVKTGFKDASISAHACWGSNFTGPVALEDLMKMLQRQHDLWTAAGLTVTGCRLGDPMSWVMPHLVEETILAIRERWPQIRDWSLHLHNGRGMALTSLYAGLRVLNGDDILRVETTLGGIGGCPYCGNGQAAGMAPTEDFVNMLEEMGIDTGIDLDILIEAAWLLEEFLGRQVISQVPKSGPRPRGGRLYPANIPFVQTFEEARHFRLGPSAYKDCPSPWTKPIESPQLEALGPRNK